MTTLSHVSPLLPWSVLRDALHGFRKVVAADLGFKSATHVDRWCSEPSDIDGDGSINPLQRCIAIVRSLQRHGEHVRAWSIIRFFNQSVGAVGIPVRAGDVELTIASLGTKLKLDGAFVQTAASALADDVLTYEELCAAHDAAIDALEHQQQIVHALAQQRTQYEAAQVTARMKPDATATKRFLELTR
jgi:hypothetical protein